MNNCLAWDSGEENAVHRTGSSLDTAIYALYGGIYSRRDGKLAVLLSQQAEDGQPMEEIAGLSRQGDQISVVVRSTQTEEERIIDFSYEDSLRRVTIIK